MSIGDVDLYDYLNENKLDKLPLKFGKVTGDFNCAFNKLTTLEGVPDYVGMNFYCNNNKLTSLEGSPEYVGWDFYCNIIS